MPLALQMEVGSATTGGCLVTASAWLTSIALQTCAWECRLSTCSVSTALWSARTVAMTIQIQIMQAAFALQRRPQPQSAARSRPARFLGKTLAQVIACRVQRMGSGFGMPLAQMEAGHVSTTKAFLATVTAWLTLIALRTCALDIRGPTWCVSTAPGSAWKVVMRTPLLQGACATARPQLQGCHERGLPWDG